MKFGVHSYIWARVFDSSLLSVLPRLRERGFDGIEIGRVNFEGFPSKAIGDEVARCGLQCVLSFGMPAGMSLITDDLSIRSSSLTLFKRAIEVATELRASLIAGPLVFPVGYLSGCRRTASEWSRAIDALHSVSDLLDKRGISLAIEPVNRFQGYFLNTIVDGIQLCEAVAHPKFGLLVDAFHSGVEEKDLADGLRRAGKHLFHFHASENDRGTPGSGHVDWRGIFSALNDLNYQNWIVIESFNYNDPSFASATCIWRDLATSPEDIAFEGVRFLRQTARSLSERV